MGIFYVNGCPVPFTEGENILKAALEAKVEIPYFCFHPALGSLGACRLCAVKVFPPKEQQGQRPRVVMSCLQPARDGMRITVKDSDAKADHQGVIEFLMTNHPHDCPVCDEGGECHLQDMTVANGPPYRRFDGGKRTFLNQYLGPLVWHDMERCITCYRCVRFYQDYALGNDFGVMGSRNQVYFGRARNGTLESPFSGNLVEICPTGVFTDKVFRRHYSRVWDLETAPSICPHCSVGCNTLPGARAGTLRRVRNRFHPQLNRWFLCDRGRYGHRYTEHPHRPLQARVDGYPVATDEALMAAVGRLQKARGVALLGSCREDMATNTALQTLATRLGARFSPFLTHALDAAVRRAAVLTDRAPTLVEMETADVVFVAGDLTGHAPMMDLAVRQALRAGARLFVLSDTPFSLARFSETVITTPAPAWADHCKRLQELCLKQVSATGNQPLDGIAAALIQAKRPLFLGVAATLGVAGIEALAALAEAVPGTVMRAFALPGPNAFGAALLGSEDATSVLLEEVENGVVDTLVVVGEDPFGAALGSGCWRRLRNRIQTLIIIDCIPTASTTTADILIPSAAWAERGGVFVNYEGRAQAF
jgi:NADH-quinone oxidoreductase subunit G